MRIAINVVLSICAAALLYICYSSIHDTQVVDEQKEQRELVVKARLCDIRLVQEAFKNRNGQYCDNFDTLIEFANNDSVPASVVKEGELDDDQIERFAKENKWYNTKAQQALPDSAKNELRKEGKWYDGERQKTLADSLAYIIKKSGDEKKIKDYGLEGFRRDTTWAIVKDYLRSTGGLTSCEDDSIKSIRYIPFSDDDEFELEAFPSTLPSGTVVYVMECRAPIECYFKNMGRLGNQAIANRKKEVENNKADRNAYAGLKIGTTNGKDWNNNAGNWE